MTGETGLLNRLADRFEPGEKKPVKIIRYGIWGTTAEIERRGPKKFAVVQKGKKDVEFRLLAEAEAYLIELVRRR